MDPKNVQEKKSNDLIKLVEFLNEFEHPMLINGWADQPQWVTRLKRGDVMITIPFAGAVLIDDLSKWLELKKQQNKEIKALIEQNNLSIVQRIASIEAGDKPKVRGVKNILVVSSAKGGVGKSTTAVNLALGLQAQGAKVGILDADIYGPSLPIMLGAQDEHPVSLDGKNMEPITAHGLYSNSIGYLMAEDNAMVWRGPMASKAFAQLMNETNWPEIDYLIVDMPPGTGDIALSLAQQFAVTSAIVITTPQDLALADAIKGVQMFDQVKVPVVGVIENMSYHICSQCGHHEAIFGQGGAVKMAKKFGLSLLGQIPLHIRIRQDIDKGVPTVIADPSGEHGTIYRQMALDIACRIYWQGSSAAEQILVSVNK